MAIVAQSPGSMVGASPPTGKVFSAKGFIDGERYRLLDRRQAYYDCTQHNFKRVDFDGRIMMIDSSATELAFTQPLLSGDKVPWYVPLRLRRPSAPYRLGKGIVNAFTNFTFGEGRFPKTKVRGDADSEDFLTTCGTVGELPIVMTKARSIGGSTGTVGISWSFVEGLPRYRCHRGKNLFVQEWEDREAFIPRHVTECFVFTSEEWDPRRRAIVKARYWHRRDWTSGAELVFRPIRIDPEDPDEEPDWEANLDVDKSVKHDDGDPHFVWIQNLPNDEGEDGIPDYDGEYEHLDEIDTVLSVVVRGAKLNLDPTLVIKEDVLKIQKMGVKKGSDQALVVDKEGGDAKYLEISGMSIKAGLELVNGMRRYVLEDVECVIPDPDQVAAAGTSGVAMRMIYERMLSKGAVVQSQYGAGMKRLLEPQLYIAQARVQVPVTVVGEDGSEEQVPQKFSLPARVEEKDVLGDDGMPTGDKRAEMHDRHPGQGEHVEQEWPERFPLTAQDKQAIVATLTTASPNKAIISQQTAVEQASRAFGVDAAEEWRRVQGEQKVDDQKEQQAMQDSQMGAGGAVGAMHALPAGAKSGEPKPGGEGDDNDEEEDAKADPLPPD